MQEAQQSWVETQSFAQLQWRPVSAAPTRSLLTPNSVWTLATVSGWSLPHLYNRILLLNHILERQHPHFHPLRRAGVVQECVGAHSRNGSNHTMHGLFTIFTWGKLKPQHLRKMRIINENPLRKGYSLVYSRVSYFRWQFGGPPTPCWLPNKFWITSAHNLKVASKVRAFPTSFWDYLREAASETNLTH